MSHKSEDFLCSDSVLEENEPRIIVIATNDKLRELTAYGTWFCDETSLVRPDLDSTHPARTTLRVCFDRYLSTLLRYWSARLSPHRSLSRRRLLPPVIKLLKLSVFVPRSARLGDRR